MTIVVAGGSGFVGTALVKALLSKGYTVVVIDRVGPSFTHQQLFFIPCDLEITPPPFNVLERTDAVINLAGRPIATKWTAAVKKQIRDSRVISTRHIIESLEKTVNRPQIFINASAVGFYGQTENAVDERAPQGGTFLADVSSQWEREALKAEDFGCRTVIVRTGTVLGKGGFLSSFIKMARFHVLGFLSKKDFFIPWIHINDIVRVYIFALETTTLQGVVNASSPTVTKSSELFKALARSTKSFIFGVLPFQKMLFGELVSEITISQQVTPQRLVDKGFEFAFTDIQSAIDTIIHETK
jgi:hypothetical protein